MTVASRPLRERLVVITSTPAARSVSSLTRSGDVATATTNVPHGYATDDYATIAGATPDAYNGRVKITVTGDTTFTYAVSGSPATPATGTITATYLSDAQAGRRETWRTVDSFAAALVEIRGSERLQAQAIGARIDYRFQTRRRADITPAMRLLWTPSWPQGSARHTLEVREVLPLDDGRTWMWITAAEVA